MHCYTSGLGSSPFARHYSGNHCLFSLPRGTKMFQFPPFASIHCCTDNYPSGNWVVPFGNPRIKGHLHLPKAYRSLSRPSSPPRAKASTRRPNLLSPSVARYALNDNGKMINEKPCGIHYHLYTIIFQLAYAQHAHTFSCNSRSSSKHSINTTQNSVS